MTSASGKPAQIVRHSTTTRVADLLRSRIAAGDLAPGERIVEDEIARECGVSRSPVREALLRLTEEGLVEIVPYRGAIVARLEGKRLADLLEFRLVLERYALERAVAGAEQSALHRLREHVVEIADALHAGHFAHAVEADLKTHRALVALAGNELLSRTYDGLLNQIRMYIRLTSARYQRTEDLADEHEALLDAIARRDLPLARSVLESHITHGFEELLKASG